MCDVLHLKVDEISIKYPTWFTPLYSQHSHILSYSCLGFQTTLVAKTCGYLSYVGNEFISPQKGLEQSHLYPVSELSYAIEMHTDVFV